MKALVVAEHLGGKLAEITFEMIALAQQSFGGCDLALIGGDDSMLAELGAVGTVYRAEGAGLEHYEPERYTDCLAAIIEAAAPARVCFGHTSMGMDLASSLSARLKAPLANACIAADTSGATSRILGGKMNAQVALDGELALLTIASGAASAADGRLAGSPATNSVAAPPERGRIRFEAMVEPEAADVDITTQEVLVAIGRGIGNQEGVETAQELANALGAAVAASRPIIDAGWLPKSRQVGKSGLSVTPKLYLALGISGAPEHLEGMRGSATIVAVNTDANAPIFQVADYGLVGDLYEVCEELMEEIE
ncbi:MAG: electron transfer flavoprotein subunit alpha/FixB family protein [Myxococcales bacterium]|nr:electron transfer flavoprotein subunit alpha/FixB family protein [Myxococcales bacterium]